MDNVSCFSVNIKISSISCSRETIMRMENKSNTKHSLTWASFNMYNIYWRWTIYLFITVSKNTLTDTVALCYFWPSNTPLIQFIEWQKKKNILDINLHCLIQNHTVILSWHATLKLWEHHHASISLTERGRGMGLHDEQKPVTYKDLNKWLTSLQKAIPDRKSVV